MTTATPGPRPLDDEHIERVARVIATTRENGSMNGTYYDKILTEEERAGWRAKARALRAEGLLLIPAGTETPWATDPEITRALARYEFPRGPEDKLLSRYGLSWQELEDFAKHTDWPLSAKLARLALDLGELCELVVGAREFFKLSFFKAQRWIGVRYPHLIAEEIERVMCDLDQAIERLTPKGAEPPKKDA